jgi:metal-dependent HD superfamily phosphatase/phosphodiesterase
MKNSNLRQDILKILEEKYGRDSWILKDFRYVVEHENLKRILQVANTETSERRYLNTHGVDHGLTTAYNIIKLFRVIEEDFVKSDYIEDFPIAELKKEHVLFALLVAGYIHDAGRFYDSEIDHETQIIDAIDIIKSMKEIHTIFNRVAPIVSEHIIPRIRELCLCHDQKEKPSGKVEIALIKLADALDCSKSRVYQKDELEKMEPKEKNKHILIRDERPEKYFGSECIEDITVDWDDTEKFIDISVLAKNYACSVPIKTILNILRNCDRSGESVQEFARRIHIDVEVKDEEHRFPLYPEKTVSTPKAKIINNVFKFDILNCEGNTKIEDFFEIKNEKTVGRITSHPCMMEGAKSIKWEDMEVKAWKIVNSKQSERLKVAHKTSDKNGKIQSWTILLNLKEGETIKVRQVYSWPGFFKTEKDQFEFTAFTTHSRSENKDLIPTKAEENVKPVLLIDVLFPKQMRDKLKAYYLLKDLSNEVIFGSSLSIEEKNGRPLLHLKHDYPLKIGWKLDTQWYSD